jgi:protein phosphatase
MANEAGGVDNTTVVILDFDDDDDDAAAEPDGQAKAAGAVAPAPAVRRTRSPRLPTRRMLLWAGVVVAVVVVGLVGLRLYLDAQWYVGVSNGHVAIYRGIPTEVAGFELHHVVVETTISAGTAESLAFYQGLGDGITAEDRERASAIVERIRRDVDRLQQIPKPNQPDSSNVSGS